MDDEYFKEQAARVRNIASFADPFTKKRLLDLAERYDTKSPRRPTPLPKVTPSSVEEHPNDQDRGGDAS